MKNPYKLSAKDIREIVAAGGLSHAEFVLDQAESQLGCDKLKEARAELQKLVDEELGLDVPLTAEDEKLIADLLA